jgi:hypothetical protein
VRIPVVLDPVLGRRRDRILVSGHLLRRINRGVANDFALT